MNKEFKYSRPLIDRDATIIVDSVTGLKHI